MLGHLPLNKIPEILLDANTFNRANTPTETSTAIINQLWDSNLHEYQFMSFSDYTVSYC